MDKKPQHPRSHHWPAIRAEHLRLFPACAACGIKEFLEVHHKVPFHAHPELELAHSNLITLCESPGRNCHYCFGHSYNWHGWNPNVEDDAMIFKGRVEHSIVLARSLPSQPMPTA